MRQTDRAAPPHARWSRSLTRALAQGAIAAYLAVTAGFFLSHLFDARPDHPVGYFFTWDMFPFYHSESARRVAVGRTTTGRLVQLVPSGLQQVRGGVNGDFTRVDLERSGKYLPSVALRDARLANTANAIDPVVEIELFERYRLPRLDDPHNAYRLPAEVAGSERTHWRARGTIAVPAEPTGATR